VLGTVARASRKLALVFMGTPEFAATILDHLLSAGHEVRAVYTQPPRPKGRGHRMQPSAVHVLAEQCGFPVRCPNTLRAAETQSEFAAFGADAAVVAAYGLLLPPAILAAPRFGCINVHASLLPRWRGAAPVQRAILAGDGETGITIMQMEEGLDTGPILMQEAAPVEPDATAGLLTERLADIGGRLACAALDGVAEGRLAPRPQPSVGVTYAPKLAREEARLDWSRPASALERQARALDPWPGAFFEYRGERIKVLAAAVLSAIDFGGAAEIAPGTVLDERLSVRCGDGVLRLLRLQRPGRTAQDMAAFLRGYPISAGTVLPCPVIA